PTTRMGVTWVFRKALYDAARYAKGLPVSGADTPSEAALAVLIRVLEGDIPLRIQARTQHDITTALRLTEEFDLPFVLEEATEAYRCLDELAARRIPVIFGPVYVTAPGPRARSAEVSGARLHTMKALLDAGIDTALTAHELRDEDGLARQAMYAMRFGVSRGDVTRAVTQTPAKLLGLDGEIGTLVKGKNADIVVWSGLPFAATSRPMVILIDGEIVLDQRAN
ncbi:MAG: amidohydrolase family protein, partial [Armatimonadetes bacterium]|nr:amidohydrolase family protein [Armatimonadota bacterium]